MKIVNEAEILLKSSVEEETNDNLNSPSKNVDVLPTVIWHSKKVNWHVTTMMDAEQIRRLVGNDQAFICFKDEGESFDSSELTQLGNMPQIFVVVQPYAGKYRVNSIHRKSSVDCSPGIPKGYLFEPEDIFDFILCKLYNGALTAFTCPPMNRLIQTPRSVIINEIVDKYVQSKNSRGTFLKLKNG